MVILKNLNQEIVKVIRQGGIGVIPTDTIYGLVGSALNKKTVERIYKLRKRNLKKPMIILIGDIKQLKKFGISLYPSGYTLNPRAWPPKTSLIFPCESAKFHYLHRGTKTLAFRLPKPKKLRSFLKKTGPLVAPSANFEGEPPSKTIKEAQKYFGNRVDFYVNAGKKISKPSRLLKIVDDKIIELRK